MICSLDVDYRTGGVATACVGFESWTDEVASLELVLRSLGDAPAYEPGAFYKRELPYLRAALARMPALEVILVDGYVWLGADRPGLGKILHDVHGAPVIGVAKTLYAGADAVEVLRGESKQPLHVTAAGIDVQLAADHVRSMHGEFRIPTLLKRADALARGHTSGPPSRG